MNREEITLEIERMKEQSLKSKNSDKYKCPICKDERGFFFDLDGYETWIKCECAERQIAIDRMRNSGIMEEDRKKTINDFITFGEKQLEQAKETVKRYMESFSLIKGSRNNSLLLTGKSGSGKTMLGIIASMNIITEHHTGLRYVPYRSMITMLKQNIMDEYRYSNEIGNLISAQVLFIDDLFKGRITESDINIMYEIINVRYLERKPIIISTERNIDSLMEVDEAIGSRIVEMAKGNIVVFDDNTMNYRLR